MTSAYGFNFRPLVNSHWLQASNARHIAATTAKAIHGLTSEVPRKQPASATAFASWKRADADREGSLALRFRPTRRSWRNLT